MVLHCSAAIQQALSIFRNEPAVWRRIQLNGMAKDFSWQVSAIEYAKLYEGGLEIQKPKGCNFI